VAKWPNVPTTLEVHDNFFNVAIATDHFRIFFKNAEVVGCIVSVHYGVKQWHLFYVTIYSNETVDGPQLVENTRSHIKSTVDVPPTP